MMKAVLALALFLFGGLAIAEDTTKTVFKKKDKLAFTGLNLKGQLKKPDLSYIYKRRGLRAEQIVNIPENFNDEIIQGENQF